MTVLKDIECFNLLTRYAKRPKTMENITLADFAANHVTKNNRPVKKRHVPSQLTTEDLIPEKACPDSDDNLSDPEMEDKTMYRKVRTSRIIRYVHFNPDTDEEKFCRERIMLFSPWRNEEHDLISGFLSYKEKNENIRKQIEKERNQYEPFRKQVDEAEKHLNEEADMQEIWDNIAPVAEDTDGIPDQSVPTPVSTEEQYDIGPDLGLPPSTCSQEAFEIAQQRTNGICHPMKTSDKPIFLFLSGGAGCGKTHVWKALYQMAVEYYNSIPGKDFTHNPVLLMAPIGKAAYHL